MVHVKKTAPEPFEALLDGSKTFEWRKDDDCRYEVGDMLILLEWLPPDMVETFPMDRFGWRNGEATMVENEPARYSGRLLKRRVTYVLRGEFGIPEGFVCMSLTTVEP